MAGQLENVYWIGGGSGGAKSTIARKLAARHRMRLYSTDLAMAAHGQRRSENEWPLMARFAEMSMDERWVSRSPIEMLKTFHWFAGEAFNCIIEDIQTIPPTERIVVEGFRLLPRYVFPFLAKAHQALWLLPTPEFRRVAFDARGTTWDIPRKTTKPERALENLLTRDALFTDQLREEVLQVGLESITVDGQKSEDALTSIVEDWFRIA